MILKPWSTEDLDQREEIAYGLILRGLRSVTQAALAELDIQEPLTAATEPTPPPDDLTAAESAALAAWGIFVQTELDPFLADTFTQGAEFVVDGLASVLDVPPVGSEATDLYLSSVANRLRGVGTNMWQDIRTALLEGFQVGEGISELAERLQVLAGMSEVRARMVARTEVVGAANAGSYLQVLESGLDGTKEWLDTDDDRTRLAHRHVGDTVIPLTEKFSVEMWQGGVLIGHEDMEIPGDVTASAGNVINCRCTPVFDLDDTLTAAARTYTSKAKDRKTGKPIASNKPVYLRVKTLFETDYPDGAVMAVRADSNERIVWDASAGKVRLERLEGMSWREDGVYTRGSLMRLRKDEQGWRTPSGDGFKASAPTVGKPITTASARAVHTGAMIALVPSDADLDRLKGDEDRNDLHLTLAFLGEAHNIPQDKREQIIDAALPHFTRPVHTAAFGVSIWNPHRADRDTALVLDIEGSDLVDPHSSMLSAVRGVYALPDQYKPWRPHVTMAYTDQLQRVHDFPGQLGSITFDKLRFAFAGEVIDYPLYDESFDEMVLTAASRLDPDLRRYWLGPKGSARVGGWGNPGSYTACQREMRKEGVEKRYIDGLCANLYRAATGHNPGRQKDESAMEDITTADAFATPKYAEWQGILTFEGTESGDGRMFALGALDWAQLPQPLMYQPESIGGHDGSVMVGQINTITRQGNSLYGTGIIDLAVKTKEGFELGKEVYRLMSEEFLTGVSVDVDSVSNAEIELITDPGTLTPRLTVFKRGRVRGATLVAFPAFADARVYLTDNLLTASMVGADILTVPALEEAELPLVASSHTITIPDLPPAGWFERPTDVKLTGALTITDEGRVYGLLAPKNTTHRARPTKVPTRNVDYSRFMKGETIVEGGGRVVTGVLTMNCGHAPTENYGTLANRIEHYDNTCSVVANVAVGEHDGEVWVAGALNPFATPEMVTKMLGCSLSGDWQPHPDRQGVREFIAALLVPVPGFAMARTAASVQRYDEGMLVASSVPVVREESDPFAVKEALAVARMNERKMELVKQLGRDNV